jgi:hypothetical protein
MIVDVVNQLKLLTQVIKKVILKKLYQKNEKMFS